jgi:hypothetical protein
LGDNLAGSLLFDLVNGHDYELSLSSTIKDDRAFQTAIGTTAGSHSEIYDWSVAAVPEPASWSLMIMGFAGMGAALRRRRTAVAA